MLICAMLGPRRTVNVPVCRAACASLRLQREGPGIGGQFNMRYVLTL